MPKPQSTMPVATAEKPSVIRTGASRAAAGSAAVMRSTSDAARMPVTAAVELSTPPIANGTELPSARMAARMADEIKVAATPYDKYGVSGPEKISSA